MLASSIYSISGFSLYLDSECEYGTSLTLPAPICAEAELGATRTELIAHSENYRGKVMLLGSTIVDEEENAQYL